MTWTNGFSPTLLCTHTHTASGWHQDTTGPSLGASRWQLAPEASPFEQTPSEVRMFEPRPVASTQTRCRLGLSGVVLKVVAISAASAAVTFAMADNRDNVNDPGDTASCLCVSCCFSGYRCCHQKKLIAVRNALLPGNCVRVMLMLDMVEPRSFLGRTCS